MCLLKPTLYNDEALGFLACHRQKLMGAYHIALR
jgi:hypothetical protein